MTDNKNIFELLKEAVSLRDPEYITTDYRPVIKYYDTYHNFPVFIPFPLQDSLGKMLFYHTEDNEWNGFKAGTFSTVQHFHIYYTDNLDKFYVSFYLPLKSNWEEYVFTVLPDGSISLTEAKIPTHIEKRHMPDVNVLLDVIKQSAELFIAKA